MDGRKSGGIRFGVGSLAHLLKNRFYIGEVTYRGEMHRGNLSRTGTAGHAALRANRPAPSARHFSLGIPLPVPVRQTWSTQRRLPVPGVAREARSPSFEQPFEPGGKPINNAFQAMLTAIGVPWWCPGHSLPG